MRKHLNSSYCMLRIVIELSFLTVKLLPRISVFCGINAVFVQMAVLLYCLQFKISSFPVDEQVFSFSQSNMAFHMFTVNYFVKIMI